MNLSKVEDAGRLLEEVSAGSWPEDMKQELLQAVAKRGGEASAHEAAPEYEKKWCLHDHF